MDDDKIAYSIPAFCRATDLGRSFVYEEIKAGRLRTVKVGARTLIPAEDARDWFKRRAEARGVA